jgi:hippurate hydrolase
MVSEDFGAFGRAAGAPSVMFFIGASNPEAFAKAKAAGTSLPNVHSPLFAPDRERTIRTGVTLLTVAALDLLGKPAPTR